MHIGKTVWGRASRASASHTPWWIQVVSSSCLGCAELIWLEAEPEVRGGVWTTPPKKIPRKAWHISESQLPPPFILAADLYQLQLPSCHLVWTSQQVEVVGKLCLSPTPSWSNCSVWDGGTQETNSFHTTSIFSSVSRIPVFSSERGVLLLQLLPFCMWVKSVTD